MFARLAVDGRASLLTFVALLFRWVLVMPPNFNMMLDSGNGTIGGMAAGSRADPGEDNTHWIAEEG